MMAPCVLAWWSFRSLLWIGLWCSLAASAVLLAVFWKSHLRHAATWKKCAIFSLWIHVLLACLATTVRMFSENGPGMGDGDQYGPPIRVSLAEISDEALSEESVDVAAAIANLQQDADAKEAPAIEDEKPPEVATEEEVTEKAEPPSVTATMEAEGFEAPDLLIQQPPTVDVKSSAPEKLAELPSAETRAAAATPPPTKRPSGLASAYTDRFATNRNQLVAGRGGSEHTEEAVRSALAWLAAAQSSDGRWDPARFGAGQERYVLGHDRGGAGARADAGVTGLALLALLGAGNTQHDGEYAVNVARGLAFLKRAQRSDGNLGGDAELFARMYCHSMAMFAASEAYAITRDRELAPIVRAAAAYSLSAQHPTDGGWRYRPGDTGDTSQLGWQLMALKSAELAGVEVPEASWTRVERFLRQVERGTSGGLAAYRPEGPPTRTMTAEALYCRQLLSERLGQRIGADVVDEATRSLLDAPPSTEMMNLYYWYYATLALHHGQHASPGAAAAWRRWNHELVDTLLAAQKADGSWPETCIWGGYGGRVYTTALAAMSLEVYYRYSPGDPSVAGSTGTARRDEWQSVPQR